MKVFYNEFDKDAARWLRNLSEAGKVPRGFVDSRSIAELTPEEIDQYDQAHFFAGIGGWPLALELAGVSPEADIWTGSCPCQPFSVAGQGKGVEDERHLWPVWRELIRECKPSIIFGEQVASKAGKDWLDAVRLDLEDMGYAVGSADLCAAGVGAPHIRQRVYFGAVRRVANGYNEGLQGHTGNGSSDDEQGRHYSNPAGPTPATSGNDGLGNAHDGSELRRGGEATRQIEARGLRDGLGNATGERRERLDALLQSRGQDEDCLETSGDDAGGRREHSNGVGFGHKIKDVWETKPLGADALYRMETPFGDGIEVHRARRADGRGADWLLCRDPSGVPRWRPVLSGTLSLAHGVSGRVVKLRGYGNAIVPQLAATFIAAFMESI